MRAFVSNGPGEKLVEEIFEEPKIKGTMVLLKIRASGVCHTDCHSIEGAYKLSDNRQLTLTSRGLKYPAVFGHEIVGEVIGIGDEVEQIKIGDKRLVYPWIGCGDCVNCLSGLPNYCSISKAIGVFQWGGFADLVVVPDEKFLLDHKKIDDAWAATLACSGLTAYSAIKKLLPIDDDSKIAVLGCGGVGLNAIAILSSLTKAKIIAFDILDDKLEKARELGAWNAYNIQSISNGDELRDLLGFELDGACDFVNTGVTFKLLFDNLTKGGTLVSVGVFGGEAKISTALLPLKAIRIIGSYVGTPKELYELIDLASSGKLKQIPINKITFDLDSLNMALDGLAHGEGVGRYVLLS